MLAMCSWYCQHWDSESFWQIDKKLLFVFELINNNLSRSAFITLIPKSWFLLYKYTCYGIPSEIY